MLTASDTWWVLHDSGRERQRHNRPAPPAHQKAHLGLGGRLLGGCLLGGGLLHLQHTRREKEAWVGDWSVPPASLVAPQKPTPKPCEHTSPAVAALTLGAAAFFLGAAAAFFLGLAFFLGAAAFLAAGFLVLGAAFLGAVGCECVRGSGEFGSTFGGDVRPRIHRKNPFQSSVCNIALREKAAARAGRHLAWPQGASRLAGPRCCRQTRPAAFTHLLGGLLQGLPQLVAALVLGLGGGVDSGGREGQGSTRGRHRTTPPERSSDVVRAPGGQKPADLQDLFAIHHLLQRRRHAPLVAVGQFAVILVGDVLLDRRQGRARALRARGGSSRRSTGEGLGSPARPPRHSRHHGRLYLAHRQPLRLPRKHTGATEPGQILRDVAHSLSLLPLNLPQSPHLLELGDSLHHQIPERRVVGNLLGGGGVAHDEIVCCGLGMW
jgi:hypothetical protein